MRMEAKVFRYCAAALAGLEEVVADELKSELADLEQVRLDRRRRQGRVFFTYRRSPCRLLHLRTPLSLYGVLAQVQGITVGPPGLERLLAQLQGFDLAAAQRLLRGSEPEADPWQFQLSVTLQGAHRFTKSQVVQRLQAQLRARGLVQGQGQGLLRLQLQIEGPRALLGLQLGPNRADACVGEGGIGGPLAACVDRLLPATGTEVLLTLGCNWDGAEILAAGARRAGVIAVDPEGRRVRDGWAGWVRGLPGELPVADEAVDLVLAAGPGPAAGLGEVARVLHPGGVAALLAPRSPVLAARLSSSPEFAILAGLPINLKGRVQVLWLLERRGEPAPLLQIEGSDPGG